MHILSFGRYHQRDFQNGCINLLYALTNGIWEFYMFCIFLPTLAVIGLFKNFKHEWVHGYLNFLDDWCHWAPFLMSTAGESPYLKFLFNNFGHISMVFIFLYWFVVLYISLLQILCQIYVIFSYSEDYIFILLMVSFNEQMFFTRNEVNISYHG